MQTHNLGYPRIGSQRELKKACEKYWAGKITQQELLDTGKKIRMSNWILQQEAGIDLIPSNDFSFYDQVLDMSLMFGVVPDRFKTMADQSSRLDLYFAMARGYQKEDSDITAKEMTKWFDTNYHYIVPEFKKDQQFNLLNPKALHEFLEAKEAGISTKPVLISPVSYLLLGKEKESNFHRIELIENLLPVYLELLKNLVNAGAEWIQLDEPYLASDLEDQEKKAIQSVYKTIKTEVPQAKILVSNYFGGLEENLDLALSLPIDALHLDLVRCPEQLTNVLQHFDLSKSLILSLGIVDGRNIWKNNFAHSKSFIDKAVASLNTDRIWLAPSCSLLHSPCDLDLETQLNTEIKSWLAFAKQKLDELTTLKALSQEQSSENAINQWNANLRDHQNRKTSSLIHNPAVKERINAMDDKDTERKSPFASRQKTQKTHFNLPLFPTTTIGSFPQTTAVRRLRSKLKKGEITLTEYESDIEQEITQTIKYQEELGIDVLVHGEFERNDMVEYFGELLEGFAFTQFGWVQSYGSRCVKPPVIYGDVARNRDLSVRWSSFAQEQTQKLVKGMLTGPVTILQWSFVRDDQARSTTAYQIALAIRDEVLALEEAGIQIIQIDEPAFREGLPLRQKDWQHYLNWAVKAFKISSGGVKDTTQIHTHMCYSEFHDILHGIAAMDADVITIETSRSDMELLDAFVDFQYPNEIGPGVYDIHSPRVPGVEEIIQLLNKAKEVLPLENIWVNPDCGLKTRKWEETKLSLNNMVKAAHLMREQNQLINI